MRRTTRRAVLRTGASLAGVGLAGCAGTADSGESSTTEAPGTTTASTVRASGAVGMTCDTGDGGYYFSPELLWVEVGATVTWSAQSSCKQRTQAYHPDNDAPRRIPDGAEAWSSDVLKPQQGSFEHTLTTEGVYDYFGLYESLGQVGTVIVGHPDPADEPGLADPQASLPEPARRKLRALNDEARALLDG